MSKKLKIYTMNFCPYCEMAKRLAKQKGIAFEEQLVPEEDDATWDRLEKETGFKTMPQIFVLDGATEKFIGGYKEMAALESSGKLDEMLK